MSAPDPRYFALDLDQLRAVARWSAECAERVLHVFEERDSGDPRPREAILGAREFVAGGKRTARLRTLALAAHAAAREAADPGAAAAARAAGTAAASAYTHPLRDVEQTKHVVGAAAYAALALELEGGGDPCIGDAEVLRAIRTAPAEAREVLLEMNAREPGRSRLDALMYGLDAGIRARGVEIRPMGEADLATVSAMLDAGLGAGFWGLGGPDWIRLVVVDGGTVAGVGVGSIDDRVPAGLDLPGPVGVVNLVCVDPLARGRGIATTLVEAVARECERRGAATLLAYAWAHARTGLVPLGGVLRRAGFTFVERIDDLYAAGSIAPCPACGELPCICSADVYVRPTVGTRDVSTRP